MKTAGLHQKTLQCREALVQSSACHSEIPKLSVSVSTAVPAQDRIKPGTISNEYVLHYFYCIGFLLTDGFTGVAHCKEISLPDTEMRERITAEGANEMSAQVQVYGTAFLSTFGDLRVDGILSAQIASELTLRMAGPIEGASLNCPLPSLWVFQRSLLLIR